MNSGYKSIFSRKQKDLSQSSSLSIFLFLSSPTSSLQYEGHTESFYLFPKIIEKLRTKHFMDAKEAMTSFQKAIEETVRTSGQSAF